MNTIHRPILSDWDFFLFRIQGPGLGNLLFPLYRAFQNQKKYGGHLVFPQFRQIKIGPYLRREKDKRTYGELFSRRSTSDILLQARSLFQHQISEADLTKKATEITLANTTIKYFGLANYFKDFDINHRQEFTQYLIEKSKSKSRIADQNKGIGTDHVAIHLRLGDFQEKATNDPLNRQMNARTDINWYKEQIERLRAKNPKLRLTLFTDEPQLPSSLLAQLGQPDIDNTTNALEAIIHMSNHRTIIGSKSSFTLWAAYLGQSNLILPKDFDVTRYTTPREIKYETA